ncbi:Putative transposon protein [Durusdinium trenchii]|uniref:Transposon protein n=1 Tax=Durusdinium trenchii TaxID=1381693 RepID=A0ABP0Q8P5_9DINO
MALSEPETFALRGCGGVERAEATPGTAGPAIQVRDGAEPPLSVPSVAFRPEEEIWVDGVEEHNTLLTKDNVEVIVPLHRLVKLGYRLQWTSAGVKITHPQSGRIECALRGGCPVLSEKQALALLDIMEKEDKGELMLDEEIRNWWSSRFPDVPQEVWNHMRGPHGYGEDQPSRSRAVERGRAALAEAGCRSYAAVEASAEGALGHASEESQGYRVRLQGYEKRGETGTIEGSWTRALAGEGLIEEDPSQMPVWLGIETAVTGGNREPEDTDSSHSRGSFEKENQITESLQQTASWQTSDAGGVLNGWMHFQHHQPLN